MLQELCRVRRPGRTTHASVGVELPVSAAFPVCQPARDHGVGAGHRLPRHCHAPGQESGPYPPSGQDGRGHPDPAFWIGAQSECSLPHAVSRRCVCRAIPRLSAFPLGQGADHPRAHPADAHHRPPGGSLSGTARPAGTGCRKQLSGLGCGG
nr:transposase [Escherichia coli]